MEIERPVIKFPKFNGESLSYLKFKKEFLTTMGFWTLNDKIKAIHLMQSLPDWASIYVNYDQSYDEMWKSLDQEFNNHKWTLTFDSLKDFFAVQMPNNETNEFEKYWDTAKNKLRYILALELSTEHVLVHYIITTLPNPFKRTFILRLPTEYLGNKLITIDEANDIFNKVINRFQLYNTNRNNNDSCKQVSVNDQNDSDDQNDSSEENEDGTFAFPKFHGDRSNYKHFKSLFKVTAEMYDMGDKEKLHFLKNSLKDAALRYIGNWGPHHDSYDNMWKYLDKRYNDLWLVANEKVKHLFNRQQQINGDDHKKIDDYWLNATCGLRNILSLELDLENIFCIYIMQCLPAEFHLELVNKLQCKDQVKEAYRIEKIEDAFNEIMAFRKITQNITTHDAGRKDQGYRGSGRSRGRYRGRGRGRAWKRYD